MPHQPQHQARRGHPQPVRPNPNIRYTSSPPALLSHSTITFLASWRGQLLVCTVVLIVGGIYFFVRDPIAQWSRRRREALSKLREHELMSMELQDRAKDRLKKVDEDEKEETGAKLGARERGREKRKEGKKRNGSILRVNNTESSVGPSTSSIESSPVPIPNTSTAASPIKVKRPLPNQYVSPTIRIRQPTDEATSPPPPAQRRSSATPSRHRAPPPPIIVPRPITVASPTSVDPWDIPLPPSPSAGPSRLNGNGHASLSADHLDASASASDDASESAQSSRPDGGKEMERSKSDGFSIFPEDGYLPVLTQGTTSNNLASNKKKKRKNKAAAATAPTQLDAGSMPSRGQDDDSASNECTRSRPSHRHTRTSSIALMPDLSTGQLRDIVEKRDETIDSLRAEIGVAKAEESKALEDARRARANEERMRSDLDRARRAGGRGEGEARRREKELSARLVQLQQAYNSAIGRLGSYESILRETGHGQMLPPPPSPLLGMPPSPYAPSPSRATPTGGFIPYPSPGMYPSPLLHANSHSHYHVALPHSPSPYRRTSGVSIPQPQAQAQAQAQGLVGIPHLGDEANFAGPLTPGSSGYPMDIGSSTMPLAVGMGMGHPIHSNGNMNEATDHPEQRERRRQSIESSVLKKKVKELSSVQCDKEKGPDQPAEEDGTAVAANGGPNSESISGSGSGSVSDLISASASGSGSGSGSGSSSNSRPTSPPPPGPGPAPQWHVNGGAPGPIPSPIPITNFDGAVQSVNGFRVLLDEKNGNVYYPISELEYSHSHPDPHSQLGVGIGELQVEHNLNHDQGSEGTSTYRINGVSPHDDGSAPDPDPDPVGDEEERYVPSEPIFASLAHTPEQLEEMRRMHARARTGTSTGTSGWSASVPRIAGDGDGDGAGSAGSGAGAEAVGGTEVAAN